MKNRDHKQDTESTACKAARRRRLGLPLCILMGVVLLFVLKQNGHRGLPADPEYGWLLTFPRASARVGFKTKRCDNLASAVAEVLQKDQTEWREILREPDELDFELGGEVRKQVPLGTRVRWLRMYHRWYPETSRVRVDLPHVWLRATSLTTPTYEVLRGYPGKSEQVAGPFVKYEEAWQATIMEIANIMDRFQKGEKIEGSSDGLPAERP
jgi:hypothetical protein